MTFTFVELYDDDYDFFGNKVSRKDQIIIKILPLLLICVVCIFFYFIYFFQFF